MLDRTRTLGGGRRLRERLRSPAADAAEIRETQGAVRWLLDHPDALDALPEERTLGLIDRYFSSNYETIGADGIVARTVAGVWYRLRYRELLRTLSAGVAATANFVRSLRAVSRELDRRGDLPPVLERLADEITGVLDRAEVQRLESGRTSPRAGRVLALDRLIRVRLAPAIETARECVYELDALRSMASATSAHGFALPAIIDSERPVVRIEDLRHPVLAEPVPNDFTLAEGETLLFITGPNMAGKTTYIRACALCVHLAHAGMGVPAASMEMSPFDCLFAAINTTDDIRRHESYYLSEVRRVKEAAERIRDNDRLFAVFDEMFRGTNVHDAYAASKAVISRLAASTDSVTIVSSHLVDLADDVGDGTAVRLGCFDAEIQDGEPVYNYRLKKGASAQRLGMYLLRREGVLSSLGPRTDE